MHRLVAIAFIPNPNHFPEVNHKDKNTQNPNVRNLEWCTRKDNLLDSYKTMSPVRNYNSCSLWVNNKKIKDFVSILEAVRFAVTNYNAKHSMLEKYLTYKNIKIITSKNNRKNKAV